MNELRNNIKRQYQFNNLFKAIICCLFLPAQLKGLAYSPRNYKQTIPIQYTWPAGEQRGVPPIEDELTFAQLKAGESLLEIHIKVKIQYFQFFFYIYIFICRLLPLIWCPSIQAATFTPSGLRSLGSLCPLAEGSRDIITFCTYILLDFEVHSTPLVSGSHPNYGFTSRYALSAGELGRLGAQGAGVRVELHQALGGVQFVTHGSGHMSLMSAMEKRGERDHGHVKITGKAEEQTLSSGTPLTFI